VLVEQLAQAHGEIIAPRRPGVACDAASKAVPALPVRPLNPVHLAADIVSHRVAPTEASLAMPLQRPCRLCRCGR
jgi:hypothetical protein